MSTPVQNLQIEVRDNNNNIVGTLLTNASGLASIAVPPGKYKAIVSELSGYAFNSGTLTEAVGVPTVLDSLTVLDIDVLENDDADCSINLLQI